jgi:hypothetical protein
VVNAYERVLECLHKGGVSYMLIGALGIDYYADDPSVMQATADMDIFIKPEPANIQKALRLLMDLDSEFSLWVGEEKITDANDELIEKVALERPTVVCTDPYGTRVDLCMAVSGFTYDEMHKNVKLFRSGKNKVWVGALSDLLRTKEIAARPKDIDFLQRYRFYLQEMVDRQR